MTFSYYKVIKLGRTLFELLTSLTVLLKFRWVYDPFVNLSLNPVNRTIILVRSHRSKNIAVVLSFGSERDFSVCEGVRLGLSARPFKVGAPFLFRLFQFSFRGFRGAELKSFRSFFEYWAFRLVDRRFLSAEVIRRPLAPHSAVENVCLFPTRIRLVFLIF